MSSRGRIRVCLALTVALSALTGCSEPGVQASPELAQEKRPAALSEMRATLETLTGDASRTSITDVCTLTGDGALGGADIPRDYRCSLRGVGVGIPVPIEQTETRLSTLNAALSDIGCSSSSPLEALPATSKYACSGTPDTTLVVNADLTTSASLAQTLDEDQADAGGTLVSRDPRITIENGDPADMTFVVSLASEYFSTQVCGGLTLCP